MKYGDRDNTAQRQNQRAFAMAPNAFLAQEWEEAKADLGRKQKWSSDCCALLTRWQNKQTKSLFRVVMSRGTAAAHVLVYKEDIPLS